MFVIITIIITYYLFINHFMSFITYLSIRYLFILTIALVDGNCIYYIYIL